jgi:hypothetical protein
MTSERKTQIAASFPANYAEAVLNIELTESCFEKFEKGIYAGSMDEKWNIFLIDENMYWARSWTDNCIYKIAFERKAGTILLKEIKVSRNPNEYKGTDLEHDINIFKSMLEYYRNTVK